MKKILYIDISLNGHRKKYIEELIKINDSEEYETLILIPEKLKIEGITQYELKSNFDKKRTITTYIKFINEIRKIANDNNVDIIHMLCGDALYRFFGILLPTLRKKIVITYHHIILKGLKKYSIKRIFKKSYIGIVHTEELYNKLKSNNINNCAMIDYPMLDYISNKTTIEAKKEFKLPVNIPVLGVIGGTSKYKGLGFLIEALNKVKKECCLFVAGAIYDYDYDFIKENLKNDKIKLVTKLKRLSDEEFADAVQASDVIMLPYRREFDGASGILIESLFHNKHVIGSDHGSMGDLIKEYELGRTFETDKIENLISVTEEDLMYPYSLTEKSQIYKTKLSTEKFLEKNMHIYD